MADRHSSDFTSPRHQLRSQPLTEIDGIGHREPGSREQLDEMPETTPTIAVGHVRDRIDAIIGGSD